MLGLLNPLALWLAPLLAAPLVIHFLGRTRPRLRDFPSLLPVRGRLAQAMRRHHLKNWLQLVLRTLALLFLLLAAANPLWRPRAGFTPPRAAAALIHNGAYARLRLAEGGTALDAQQRARRGLDSLTSGNCRAELVIPDAFLGEPAARFGAYPEAISRLLRQAGGQASLHLEIPVFDWRDMEASRELLAEALRRNQGLWLVLTEYPGAPEGLAPFSGFSLEVTRDNLAVLKTDVLVPLRADPLWTPMQGSPRVIPAKGESLEIRTPLPPGGWLGGVLALPDPAGSGIAFPSAAVTARIPPPSNLCHVGDAFASLASLGRGGLRIRLKSFTGGRAMEGERCDLLYLADPADLGEALLGRAAEIARGGGRVVIGLGAKADLAMLNRNLLGPLGVGRLTELKKEPLEVRADFRALSELGIRAGAWGEPGQVQVHVGLRPDSGTAVLLAAGGDPILAYRRVGNGAVFLWTTDVDDPGWTDLGLGPWVALLHQAVASGASLAEPTLRGTASDSLFLLPASASDAPIASGPDGMPFTRIQRDPEGWRLGPFDRLGLYRVEPRGGRGADTTWFAVGLSRERLRPDPGARDRFLSALEEFRPRMALRRPGDDWQRLYGGMRLRTWMLIAAALLLFLEGVVSLRLRPAPLTGRRN